MFDAVRHLSQQHHRCDAVLAALGVSLQRGDWPQAETDFDEASFALLTHLALEENVLFPALAQASGEPGHLAALFSSEHDAIRRTLAPCRSLLAQRDQDGLLAALANLEQVIQRHNVHEESVLYPLCQRHMADLEALWLAHSSGDKTTPSV